MTEKRNRTFGVISIILLVLNCLGLIGYTLGLLLNRTTFQEIYSDFGVPLPVALRLYFATPAIVYILVTGILLALLILKEKIKRKSIPLQLNIAWMIMALVVSPLTFMVLMMPLREIIETL